MSDLEIMIILIEGEYSRTDRNTTLKMKALLLKEFDYSATEQEILKVYGLSEDYETESRKVEYGYN